VGCESAWRSPVSLQAVMPQALWGVSGHHYHKNHGAYRDIAKARSGLTALHSTPSFRLDNCNWLGVAVSRASRLAN
jgi:hypothetical protein